MHSFLPCAFVLWCITGSAKAATFNVQVGANDTLSFNPSFLTGVSDGDTVNFQFVSGNHSVVQSTFEAPCTAAGVSSGFQNVADPNGSEFPTWSPTIANASVPLFFFCSQVTATSTHCQQGMVFAINNPDPEGLTFQAFQQAAIATNATGPSNPSGTIIAGTPGAFDSPLSLPAGTLPTTAQAPSAPTSSSLTSQITPSITSSTTTPISASASSSTRGPLNVGPVVGGVIAALVLLITAGLFVFIRIRRRKAARTRSLIDLTDDDMPPHRPLTPWTVTAFRQMESLASSNKVNSARRTPAALDNKTPTEGSRNLGLERPHHVNADATIQSPDMPQEEDPVGQFPYAVQQQGQISTDLTTEEGVLLRELQIIRRLQEIRIGDVPVPPPEYE